MTDVFLSDDIKRILYRKNVVFLGDSNVRALYKDVLCLLQCDEFICMGNLKAKMEPSVFGDKLVYHGKKSNGRDYREERQFTTKDHNVGYYFLTRVYGSYVEEVVEKITECNSNSPDVLVVNSCLWDMCRWGPKGVEEYKSNIVSLMKKLKSSLKSDCLVIWLTAPPLSTNVRGGFLVVQLEFLKYCLRFHVMEANTYAAKVVTAYGYDVLDVHYHLRMQLHLRAADGIHWMYPAMRYVTNLLFTHISLAWDIPLPHRFDSVVTGEALQNCAEVVSVDAIEKESMKEGKEKHHHECKESSEEIILQEQSEKKNCKLPNKKKRQNKLQRKYKYNNYTQHKNFAQRQRRIRTWNHMPEQDIDYEPIIYPYDYFYSEPQINWADTSVPFNNMY